MYIDKFKKQFTNSIFLCLANSFLMEEEPMYELLACPKQEIITLEQKLDTSLPTAYKEFLLWGGDTKQEAY